ncbi:hypothetical protein LCGC14_3056350, partial [marine sediment metagenome]
NAACREHDSSTPTVCTFTEGPRAISEYGDFLAISAGPYTYIINPAASTPTLVETQLHEAGARARSTDVFDKQLVVANGVGANVAIATEPRTASRGTSWIVAEGVKMGAVKAGPAGRLFSAAVNRVFNVLAGQDPADRDNYLPPAGEVLTDETDPVRSLDTFTAALVGGTARTLRTFDPDRGFQGVSLVRPTRLSTSEYDGRALMNLGDGRLLYATARAVWFFRCDEQPAFAGPELLQSNESPYIGGEPGIPDFAGDWIIWPWYFPSSGDSVIFWVREREEGEHGTGPLIWSDELHLPGRECRVVRYWGGTATVKPRLFGGASTPSQPEQMFHVDLGRGGGPDLFDTDAVPASSA